MPRANGLAVLKMIRNNRRYSNIPIIVITGLEKMDILEQAFDYGANDFLFKPVKEIEIVVRVQNILRQQSKVKYLDKENIALSNLNDIIQNQNELLQEEEKKNSSVHLIEKVKLENLIAQIEENLSSIKKDNNDEVYKSKVRETLSDIKNLKNFSLDAGQITDNEFCKKLLKINPSLTNLNLQHCNLLGQNLRNDEIAILRYEEPSNQTIPT